MNTIPLFDTSFDEMEIEAAKKVIRSGWLTMGKMTEIFEKSFADFIGVKHAVAVSSGTAALHLANLALDINNGDEVICPSFTFVASANSIVHVGARPVFAEITSHDDFNISPEDIKSKISKKTKAIQVMHYAGYPCDMEPVLAIAEKYGLQIIEDCAHAPGAEYNGKKCGTLGHVGCFSFFSNKNMTTAEGGMITTDNDKVARKIKLLRSHGIETTTTDQNRAHSFSHDVVEVGFNYRIDEIRSAIGHVQLGKLHDANQRRQKLTKVYRERLTNISGLRVPFKRSHGSSSYHIFPILLNRDVNRQEFMLHFRENGIQSRIHYPAIHTFDFYRSNFGYYEGLLPLTEDIAQREVTLPLYPSMGDDAVHYVCDTLYEYFRKRKD